MADLGWIGEKRPHQKTRLLKSPNFKDLYINLGSDAFGFSILALNDLLVVLIASINWLNHDKPRNNVIVLTWVRCHVFPLREPPGK